jgi:hypothetical protein
MASRIFDRNVASLQKAMIILEGSAVIGGTGAVGTVKGSGIKSVARTGTGAYSITLDDAFNRLLWAGVNFVSATGSGIASVEITNDPQVAVKAGTAITIQCYDFAGAAADPASASVLSFIAFLRNSSVPGKGE